MKVNKSGEESSWEDSKSTPVSLSPNEALQSKPFSDVNGHRFSTHSRYKATLSLAKRSVDRMRYSLDSRHDSPLPSTKKERYSSFENVYDTLSGKQAPDDRNSWSRIKQTWEMKDCQTRESSEDGKSNKNSDRSIDLEKGDDEEDKHKIPSVIPTPESLDSGHAGSVKVCIVCEDTGAGIPADARARIFKPFVQVNCQPFIMPSVLCFVYPNTNLCHCHHPTSCLWTEVLFDRWAQGPEFVMDGVLIPLK